MKVTVQSKAVAALKRQRDQLEQHLLPAPAVPETIAQDYQQIIQQFMAKGWFDKEEPQPEEDTSALHAYNEVVNMDGPEYHFSTSRIKIKFQIQKNSTLPMTMPDTLVYWNRCETTIDKDHQRYIKQWQLEKFHQHRGIPLHPERKPRNFEMWANPQKEMFAAKYENVIFKSPIVQQNIQLLTRGRQVEGRIVRQNIRGTDLFFNSQFESGNLKQVFIIPQESDFKDILEDEMVIPQQDQHDPPQQPEQQKQQSEFNLFLQEDTCSDGQRTQWFYFSVMNIRAKTESTFNIVNMTKSESSFAQGMQPLVFSTKAHQERNLGWHRAGTGVKYQENSRSLRVQAKVLDIKFIDNPKAKELQPDAYYPLNTLTFTYQFQYDYEIVYFAHFEPYTCSDLQSYISGLASQEKLNDRMRVNLLCNSLGGKPVYQVTVTDSINSKFVSEGKEIFKFQRFEYLNNQNVETVKPRKAKQEHVLKQKSSFNIELKVSNKLQQIPEDADENVQDEMNETIKQMQRDKFYKKCIVITGRVHPGDTQTSFIAESIIDFLCSDDLEAIELRQKFVFKIVPMLNPDGVVLGNARHSALGVDENRRWQKPSKFLHPSIYYTKALIKYCNRKYYEPEVKSTGVVCFVDLHGHHHSKDIFMFSCNIDKEFSFYEGTNIVRAVPDAVDRSLPVFNPRKCRFQSEPEKLDTGRLVVFKELRILNSYTLECSFNGSDFLKKHKLIYDKLYTQDHLSYLQDRYSITTSRQDVFFDKEIIKYAAQDFMKGINLASKKKPLLGFWFRIEPKVLVEIDLNLRTDDQGDLLKEMELRWRPTGAVADGSPLEYMYDGPIDDDRLEKVKARKLEKKRRSQKLKLAKGKSLKDVTQKQEHKPPEKQQSKKTLVVVKVKPKRTRLNVDIEESSEDEMRMISQKSFKKNLDIVVRVQSQEREIKFVQQQHFQVPIQQHQPQIIALPDSKHQETDLPPLPSIRKLSIDYYNMLAQDPVVVQLREINNHTKVKLQTIIKHLNPITSPEASPKKQFIPQNGVYSTKDLFQHQALAERSDLHFQLDSMFDARRQTEPVLPKIESSSQLPLQGLITDPSRKVIEMRNGFQMSSQELSVASKQLSQRERLQLSNRPHIILKPLSEVDWQSLSSAKHRQKKSFGDFQDQDQQSTLQKLKSIIGTMEIQNNRIVIGKPKQSLKVLSKLKRKESIWKAAEY